MQKLLLFGFLLHSIFLQAQEIKVLTAGTPVSLRGLSVVNDQTIWVSGSQGTLGVTTDQGKHWKWMQVKRYEKSDFRDIEAFNDKEVLIMSTSEPAVILKTVDGGNTWKTVFEDSSQAVFLDAMYFSGMEGIVIGDPIGSRIFFASSRNRGDNWEKPASSDFAPARAGEAFFAASGTNITRTTTNQWAFVSGGTESRLFLGSQSFPLLLNHGKETTGANSISINPDNPNQAFIVGGDFSHDTARYRNSVFIQFHPFVQIAPVIPPHGYRSCVEYLNNHILVCCGRSGVDISTDGGINWKLISKGDFNTCRKNITGKLVFFAGNDGKVAVMNL